MLKKVARGQVLDVVASQEHPRGLIKDSARHEFVYQPRPGFVYVRSRMISSRVNDNWDGFPAEEIEQGYRSFLGKPAFVNHHNEDHRRMRGLIIDAHLHHHRTPDGRPDTWVEGLHEIDALTFPKLARAVLTRKIERTSMGVDVDYSICSACGNKATDQFSYCIHIPGQKGRKLFRAGKRGSYIHERCHGLHFFENSLLVEPPADPTAVFIGEPVMGPGLEHLTAELQRTASRERILVRRPRPEPGGDSWRPVEAAKYESPADHPWFQAHPVSSQHIVDMWDHATDDEKASGKRWYPDAHLVAKSIATLAPVRKGKKSSDPDARHPQGDAHLGAGMLALYSPQTPWAANMHNAARALHEGRGIGGKGSGIMASDAQRKSADRVLGGTHYNDVLNGPKIRDFAHLIEHGGDEHPVGHPEYQAHVVVDRHALSVAIGKRLTDEEYSTAPVRGAARRKDGSIPRAGYDHVVGAYRQAAQQISQQEGEQVQAHQVQAATWLAQQRLNQKAERARAAQGEDARLDRGRERTRSRSEQSWETFRRQHLPEMEHGGPGTGYTARRKTGYGETIAPPRVDTLRDETCPICGEDAAWDGHRCPVCGYVAPPSPFADPNLDVAKDIDLRQQQQQFDESTVPDPEKALEQEQADTLICSNCGTEFPGATPETVDTDASEGAQDAPAEGDICPACGQGVLEPQDEVGEQEDNPVPLDEGEAEDAAEEDDNDLDPDTSDRDDGPRWADAVPVKSSDGTGDGEKEKPVRKGSPRRKG